MSQTQTSGGSTTTTAYRYLGDTNALTRETLTGGTTTTRKYSYDALGERVTFSDGASRFSYLYDPHGSVSLLLDQSSAVKASYGYSAYGSANTAISKTAAGFTDRNPYRYEAKRLDPGSNSYDMGARRYSPGTGRWLQQDLYYGAFDNLGLAQDPLNANRYLFTGANPINYLELDGHRLDIRDYVGDPRPFKHRSNPDEQYAEGLIEVISNATITSKTFREYAGACAEGAALARVSGASPGTTAAMCAIEVSLKMAESRDGNIAKGARIVEAVLYVAHARRAVYNRLGVPTLREIIQEYRGYVQTAHP